METLKGIGKAWFLAGVMLLATFAAFALATADYANAGGGEEEEEEPGRKVFSQTFRTEIEPIKVSISRWLPGRVHLGGKVAEMEVDIENTSPSTDWIVAMSLDFDFSNVALFSPGLGVEGGVIHKDTGANYHPGDPLVVPACSVKTFVVRITAHDGVGTALVKDLTVYRLSLDPDSVEDPPVPSAVCGGGMGAGFDVGY